MSEIDQHIKTMLEMAVEETTNACIEGFEEEYNATTRPLMLSMAQDLFNARSAVRDLAEALDRLCNGSDVYGHLKTVGCEFLAEHAAEIEKAK